MAIEIEQKKYTLKTFNFKAIVNKANEIPGFKPYLTLGKHKLIDNSVLQNNKTRIKDKRESNP